MVALPELMIVAAGLIACWTDLRARRIPNALCAVTAVLGLAYAAWTGGWSAAGDHTLHAFIALTIGAGLFAARAIGGGDAKLYAALATWFALHDAVRLFVLVSCSGLVLLVVWFSALRLGSKPFRKQGGQLVSLPYGVAIAAGSAMLLLSGAGSP